MGHVLKMKPVFKEMIWGGHKLKDVYGYDIPSDHTGECWALSLIRTATAKWLMENLRAKRYPGCLKTTESYLEILRRPVPFAG